MGIDRQYVIDHLSQLRMHGDANGLIPAFGVYVNQIPARFWNSFSTSILDAAGSELREDAEGLLEHAAAECGYNTGHGIMESDEFASVVGPMIKKKPEDNLHGVYAVLAAWGWANAEIVELIPDQKMVVRAYDYYEQDQPTANRGRAFMLRGISRAFMDLAYGEPYPDGFGKFSCVQTKGIEKGDPFGEFVVTRA